VLCRETVRRDGFGGGAPSQRSGIRAAAPALTARKYRLNPVRILAIDTSGRNGSVAFSARGAEGCDAVPPRLMTLRPLPPDQEYSRVLVPEIEALLADAECLPGELDALAVAVGPGAFTGLRVGIASAQGLALALARPCVGVNTFEAWAALHADEAHIAVALDAFRGEVLWVQAEHGRLVTAPATATPEAFAEHVHEGALLVGEGSLVYAERIRSRRADVRFSPQGLHLAASVAALALRALRVGAAGAAHELRPLYLREAYVGRP
jgi:tRNA threonylcarbamoyladenosine biosynthesis protein TsaB